MVSKEILEFTTSESEISKNMESVVQNVIEDNPEISYTRIDEDVEPDLRKLIVNSQNPISHPCFVGLVDGKVNAIASGELSNKELRSLVN